MEKSDYKKGDILVNEKKISKVAKNIKNFDNNINLSGFTAMPGIIDAHSHCGLHELDHGSVCDDTNDASGYNNADLRAIDGFSYYDTALKDAYNSGVTSICITPGSLNVINGEMAVVKTSGNIIDKSMVNSLCGIKAALGENTKGYRSSAAKRPSSRMGVAAGLRNALNETINYINTKKDSKKFKIDLKYESLAKVIERKIPLRIHAHRCDDICTAIRIADEFGIKITLEHGTSAHLIPEYIADKKIPVVAGPFLSTRKKAELVDRNIKACGILERHGIKVALTVDHPVIPIDSLLFNAILAYKAGMSYKGALKSITINAAEICGCEKKIGSIKAGKDADIVILDGDPLDIKTNIVAVIIDGEIKKVSKKYQKLFCNVK